MVTIIRGIAVVIFLLIVCATTHAGSVKVIYGDDGRQDVFQVVSPVYLSIAPATAAQIPPSNLKKDGNFYLVQAESLASGGVCSTERFATQPTAARCSGFYVGADILVTAGHCVTGSSDCNNYRWVFDYKVNADGSAIKVPASSVYSCKEIIKQVQDNSTDNDFAVIRLDRPVEGKVALKYRREGAVNIGDPLVVIGHPSGLPTKVGDGARVRTITNNFYFVANLDTFGGNSGSAVFNAESGVVEGILVRGEDDYINDPAHNCQVVNRCTDDACRGEDVTRITNLKDILDQYVGNNPPPTPTPTPPPSDIVEDKVELSGLNFALPDLKKVTYSLSSSMNIQIQQLAFSVDISHSYVGDLGLVLISPTGSRYTLRSRKGGNADDIKETYDMSNVTALKALVGKSAAGIWKLEIRDYARGDSGVLNAVKLWVKGKKL